MGIIISHKRNDIHQVFIIIRFQIPLYILYCFKVSIPKAFKYLVPGLNK